MVIIYNMNKSKTTVRRKYKKRKTTESKVHAIEGKQTSNRRKYIRSTAKPKTKRVYLLMTNPPEPVTRDGLMKWLSDTGWVEGFLGKKISPLDRPYYEEYLQEVWVQILEVPEDKIVDIWHRGKGKFVNYIKSIIMNNIYSSSSHLFQNVRKFRKDERELTDYQWNLLDEDGKSTFDVVFPINDFEPGNRSLHYGIDKENCKTDDEHRLDNTEETEGEEQGVFYRSARTKTYKELLEQISRAGFE